MHHGKAHGAADSRIHPGKAAAMAFFHLAALLCFVFFTWEGLAVFLLLVVLVGQVGIGLGYHRLICHRSYRAAGPLRPLLGLLGVLNCMGGPLTWCAIHRLHHRHSDRDEDPQASHRSFWTSHLLWTLARQMPGLTTSEEIRQVTRDLAREPAMLWLERYAYALNVAFALVLLAAGWLVGGWFLGVSLLVWGFFVRIVAGWHATFLVNSINHHVGYRNYQTDDNSRNCWWVALLTFGEGWHNNHHHQPRSAAHGHRWFEVDASYLLIRGLEAVGLASEVVRPRRPFHVAQGNSSSTAMAPTATPSSFSGTDWPAR
jgi:stearoyl-CoA desaturase (delta-9 desaturase)